uniref:Uncharacterized protein n=1 Tax=Manihot esculenta TaxID=3983 RepID=A0A199UCI6_MANES
MITTSLSNNKGCRIYCPRVQGRRITRLLQLLVG